MDVWVVETQDGKQKVWVGNFRNRLFKRFPKVSKDGFVTLDNERPYVVDPKRFVREYHRPRRFLGLVEKQDVYQYWLENEPDPITFTRQLTPGSAGITSDTIKQYSKSEHLRRLVQPESSWLLVVGIAIISSVAAGAIGYILGLRA